MWLLTKKSTPCAALRASRQAAFGASCFFLQRLFISRVPWTQQDSQTLAERLEEHVPKSSIAKELKRTVKAVTRRVERLRLKGELGQSRPLRPWSESDLDRLLVAHDNGESWSNLRGEFPGRTYSQLISAHFRHATNQKAGVSPAPPKPWSTEEFEQLSDLRARRVPTHEVCRQMQRTTASIAQKTRCVKEKPHYRQVWSATEDAIVIKEHSVRAYGSNVRAAALLPGRTAAAARGRWMSALKFRAPQHGAGTTPAITTKPPKKSANKNIGASS